jgi:acetolactate synthase-1/2/3 large subunit
MEKKRGAEIFVDVLVREGVDCIFGYPGGAVLDIYDELVKSAKIRHVLVRHEQGGAHMADGYARSTGKVGVAMATSGPGATNLTTGLATAYMDSSPVVAITGQVPTPLIGNDAFQEADVCGVTRPVTKHNFLVKDVRELARTIREAFHIARTGRPGPVVVDIPKDVQKNSTNYVYPEKVDIRSYRPTEKGNPQQIQKAAKAISKAKKPLIYAGGGAIAAGAHEHIYELATKSKIPVTTTLMGLGAFPENHPLALEMLGMHGSATANYAIQECDLIIALGARFDDRVTGKISEFAPHARVIHIDVDPSCVGKNVQAHIPIVGDLRLTLEELNSLVEPGDTADWLEQIKAWKEQYPFEYDRDAPDLKPQYVIEMAYEVTKGNAIVATDVGQHQMWTAQFYKFTRPRTMLTSGGLGTMGFGFPAALGAQAGNPGKLVISIAGDGSFQMMAQELATAVISKLPVKVLILNNMYLGMVRQWQELFYGKLYAGTSLGGQSEEEAKAVPKDPATTPYVPDFVKLAEAYGAVGMRVTKKEEVVPALEKAFDIPQIVVVEFRVSVEENVFPMVPLSAVQRESRSGPMENPSGSSIAH